MKKIVLLIISSILLIYTLPTGNCMAYNITYLYVDKLLAYPTIALDDKNPNLDINDANHLTPKEFELMLQQLYDNNYVLITSPDTNWPKDKKPLVLVLGGFNYTSTPKSSGYIDKLIIDNKGNISTYTSKRSINERISSDNETIPLLETFIAAHPTFSHNNARATLAISNDDGLFGYKTAKNNANSRYDIKHAQKIAIRLKNLGYTFAYASLNNADTDSDIDFATSINTFITHTSKICGPTNIYITNTKLNSEYKTNLLKDNQFDIIWSLDNSYTNILTISGNTLRTDNRLLSIIDPIAIYDDIRPKKYYNT